MLIISLLRKYCHALDVAGEHHTQTIELPKDELEELQTLVSEYMKSGYKFGAYDKPNPDNAYSLCMDGYTLHFTEKP